MKNIRRLFFGNTIRRQFTALAEALSLDEAPERLECFDVSHTSGEATVASCVVFNSAGPLKSDYRRFNLRPDSAGDDYAAMAEALRRRYRRVKKGEVPMPDVLFVDGGKGQLAEAMRILGELELDWLNVVAVAKGRARRPGAERLFTPGRDTALRLPPDSAALLLIQQIRDEAHRFAISVGFVEFIVVGGVMGAGIDDLTKVRGIGRALAESIYNDLHLDGHN